MTKSLSRQQLYELVWSEPVSKIAPRFQVSDVWLSKLCRKHDIPQPPRGYWAKLAAGKKVSKFPLLPRGIGMPDVLTIGADAYYRHTRADEDELIASEIGPPPSFEEPIEELTAKVAKMVGKITVPRDLSRAHTAIAALLAADEPRRQKYLASSYRSPWDAPFFDSAFEKRRLRVMNALIVPLAKLGTKPLLKGKDPGDFTFTVGEQHFTMSVDEPNYQRSGWRTDKDLGKPASTRLRIARSSYSSGIKRSWEDRDTSRVEDNLTEVVVSAIVAGEEAYRSRLISAHDWRIKRKAELIEQRRKEEEERQRKEKERREAEAKARIDALLAAADGHRRANDIRTYVAQVRTALGSSEEMSKEMLDQWCSWALLQADNLDPVTNGTAIETLRSVEEN